MGVLVGRAESGVPGVPLLFFCASKRNVTGEPPLKAGLMEERFAFAENLNNLRNPASMPALLKNR